MTRDDIIRMAREAGWSGLYTQWAEPTGKPDWSPFKESLTVPVTMEQIERFAALVAEEVRGQTIESEKRGWLHAIDKMVAAERERLLSTEIHSCHANCQRFACVQTRKAVEAEREAIAQMVEDAPPLAEFVKNDKGGCMVCGFTPKLAAAAIRARGEKA